MLQRSAEVIKESHRLTNRLRAVLETRFAIHRTGLAAWTKLEMEIQKSVALQKVLPPFRPMTQARPEFRREAILKAFTESACVAVSGQP
jgi:hypothetical protein